MKTCVPVFLALALLALAPRSTVAQEEQYSYAICIQGHPSDVNRSKIYFKYRACQNWDNICLDWVNVNISAPTSHGSFMQGLWYIFDNYKNPNEEHVSSGVYFEVCYDHLYDEGHQQQCRNTFKGEYVYFNFNSGTNVCGYLYDKHIYHFGETGNGIELFHGCNSRIGCP